MPQPNWTAIFTLRPDLDPQGHKGKLVHWTSLKHGTD